MGVVDEKRIAEVAIEMSKTTEVRDMATHENEKLALTVASACWLERLSSRYNSKIVMATYQLNQILLHDREQEKKNHCSSGKIRTFLRCKIPSLSHFLLRRRITKL